MATAENFTPEICTQCSNFNASANVCSVNATPTIRPDGNDDCDKYSGEYNNKYS